MRTRVKICGITREQDALAAVAAGADAIGLVFCASPRRVELDQACQVVRSLPPFVQVVGLVVDPEAGQVAEILRRVRVDLLQFHGHETPQQCRQGRPYVKAIGMGPDVDLAMQERAYADAAALLLDSAVPGVAGGTGVSFEWSRVPQIAKPVVLAGGLNAGTVAQAIACVHPYAVDVSSGVESAKGIKDQAKMKAFIEEVRRADEKFC